MPGPVISAIASFIVPGAGQLLNGKYVRGLIFLVVFGGLLFIVFPILAMIGGFIIYLILHLLYVIFVARDAYRIAKSVTV